MKGSKQIHKGNKVHEVVAVLKGTRGQVFGAEVKKKDGSWRRFNARLYEDSMGDRDLPHHNVLVVDMTKTREKGRTAYRTINIPGVREIKANGVTHIFED